MAIKACESQIKIASKVAAEELKGEKRFILKSDAELLAEFEARNAGDFQTVDKYAGKKLPEGFDPNIHKSPDEFEIIQGKLGEHTGYKQLCIIREKQGNYEEVIRLAEEAKSQGWRGDWDKRIEKAKKKLGENINSIS